MRSMANSIFIFPPNEHLYAYTYIYKRILRILQRLRVLEGWSASKLAGIGFKNVWDRSQVLPHNSYVE